MISVVDGFDGRIVYVDEPGPLADTSVRSELRAGQVWLDRSGDKVTICENPDNDERPFCGSDRWHPRGRNYTSNGIRYGEDETGPSYLVCLIKDVEEKKVEPDLSKPVRLKVDHTVQGRIVYGPTKRGFYLIEFDDDIGLWDGNDLENIPEPKITASINVILYESDNGSRRILRDDMITSHIMISKAHITHTEGEGWSVEEVE